MQARLKALNQLIHYIPCSAHLLNLIGSCAAESCINAVLFFGFLQNFDKFFSASTKRWAKMKSAIKGKTVKPLFNTRWSARSDATTALKENFVELRQLLQDFTSNNNETNRTKSDSSYLKKSMDALETAILCDVWYKIVQRFHSTSKSLQRADMSLGSCVAFYNGIESFCQHLWDEFDTIEKDSLKLTIGIQKTYASQNKRKRKTKKTYGYEGENNGCTRALKDAHESFCIGTYLPVIDSLIAKVRRRKSVYCILQQNFNFLLNLNTWAISNTENAASKLLKYTQAIWIATFL